MSNATQPSESDFHDSHPVSGPATDPKTDKATQSIGDLTSIESEVDTPSSHSLGDLSRIEENQSEILGDISLLDEAFAEMEDSSLPSDAQNDNATEHQVEKSKTSTDTETAEITAEDTSEIPVLNDTIDAPTESKIIAPETMAASVPILDQEATDFAEMLKPASPQTEAPTPKPESKTEAQSTEPTTPDISEALFSSPDAQNNPNLNDLEQSLAMAAEILSESPSSVISPVTTPETASQIPEASSSKVSEIEDDGLNSEVDDTALEALLTGDDVTGLTNSSHVDTSTETHNQANDQANNAINSEISNDDFAHSTVTSVIDNPPLSELLVETTSIDEKIAIATGISEFEINEQPLGSLSQTSEFPSGFAEDLIGSQDDNFGENSAFSQSDLEINTAPENQSQIENNTSLNSIDISEFNPDEDLKTSVTQPEEVNSTTITQASHTIGITGQGSNQAPNNININIPFELHSQLSQKIDELVVDATSSITEELHTQLTNRLDALLGNAVESVLPKLVNQMATELRHEINGQVKQQLPNIINEVLNKTRLQK